MVNKNNITNVSLVESLFNVNIIYYDLCTTILKTCSGQFNEQNRNKIRW